MLVIETRSARTGGLTMEASLPAPSAVAGAALIGCATGLRSQMGLAVLVNRTQPAQLPALLRHRAARPITATAALAELIADKLPSTPPRTQARGLVPRLGLGGLCAGLLARNAGVPVMGPVAVGAGTAAIAAFAGMAARGALAKRIPPVGAALVEDVVAVLLAVVALRLSPAAPSPDQAVGPPRP
jgi:uncharacterized membrane protein